MQPDFAMPSQYERQAFDMSGGAQPTAGMPAYPLYGYPPLGQVDPVPVYRRPLVCFGAGAAVVGAAWLYFAWWRPKQAKIRKNAKKDDE